MKLLALCLVLANCTSFEPFGLEQTNIYRRQHGVANLTWSTLLQNKSLEWAKELSRTCSFIHSKNDGYGENLYMSGTSANANIWSKVVKRWYDEISNYNYTLVPYTTNKIKFENIGHFTQLVWKTTKFVGCASSESNCKGKRVIYVCKYDPIGNYASNKQYLQNVLPKINRKKMR